MIRASRRVMQLAAEGPRVTIAKNILTYEALSKATTEAELEAAMKSSPAVDVNNLAPGISHMKEYLSTAPAAAEGGFKRDANAWQNLPFAGMVAEEAGRDMTWPFLAGGVAVFFILGMGIPSSLPAEGKKGSKYISMIEGRHGKLEGGGH